MRIKHFHSDGMSEHAATSIEDVYIERMIPLTTSIAPFAVLQHLSINIQAWTRSPRPTNLPYQRSENGDGSRSE
jgi:hypothetical protein